MPFQSSGNAQNRKRNIPRDDMNNQPFGQSVPNMQTQQPMPMPSPMMSGVPTTVQNPYYTAGFLNQYIGHNMRVEYLLGTNGPLVDRIGRLVEVGASYIVLQPYLSDDLLMTDLDSIRFVTIYE